MPKLRRYDRFVLFLAGITEMRHHELLGKLIVSFGGTPYVGGNRGFWQGGFIDYTRKIDELLDNDVASEQEAIKYYNEVADRTKSENVREIVERIILDEQVHIQTLKEIKRALRGENK